MDLFDGILRTRKSTVMNRADTLGVEAYLAGLSITDNPYDSAAYAYTDEGLASARWRKGFEEAWFDAGCPVERWPDMANTIAAVERREAFRLGRKVVTGKSSSGTRNP